MNPAPSREQMEAVATILNANGIRLNLPWQCDLDDREREVYHAIEDAVAVALRMESESRPRRSDELRAALR